MLDGKVIGRWRQRHRHSQWREFLRQVNRQTPRDKGLHLICDHYATHEHAKVQQGLAAHPRFHVHFTPISASWLNMAERFLRALATDRLRPGGFRGVPELVAAIEAYVDHHNEKPKPVIGTATANDILAKITRANTKLMSKRNEALHVPAGLRPWSACAVIRPRRSVGR